MIIQLDKDLNQNWLKANLHFYKNRNYCRDRNLAELIYSERIRLLSYLVKDGMHNYSLETKLYKS